MTINAVTFVVADPSSVARAMSDAFGWMLSQDHGTFAEIVTGSIVIWLNGPSQETSALAEGVVLHVEVDDVRQATEQARKAGASILREPTLMDFGVESAYAQVPGGPVIDLMRTVTD
ncbi:MAG: hypothetical protein QM705_11905 [Ancrocorticia sp.]